MAALAVGLAFLGYAVGLQGYCLLKGYDIQAKELWSPIWPPGSVTGKATAKGSSGDIPGPEVKK